MREILTEEKNLYNEAIRHPLQSWEWGQFRQVMGNKVIRIGNFEGDKMQLGYQFTLHKLPFASYVIGYLPKGPLPDINMLTTLECLGLEYNCIFIKIEPNILTSQANLNLQKINSKLKFSHLQVSPKPLFTKFNLVIDLTQTEEELLKKMKPKTRYNIKIAQRNGVKVSQDNSLQTFQKYLNLLEETTKRQEFFAHNRQYQQKMWQIMSAAGIAHMLKATYQNKTLVVWILFLFKNRLYYPYGASVSTHRHLMASNLLMWEAMLWGKKMNAQLFDLWGSLDPNPDVNNPWYGFHRFKEGYSPKSVEYLGSFDLVLNPLLYKFYYFADNWRWRLLKLKRKLKF